MTDQDKQQQIKDLFNAVGRKRLMAELDVSENMIKGVVRTVAIPAKWLPALQRLATDSGVEWDPTWDFTLFNTTLPKSLEAPDTEALQGAA